MLSGAVLEHCPLRPRTASDARMHATSGSSEARPGLPRAEPEPLVGRLLAGDHPRCVFGERRAVLEPVARPAAEDPVAVELRMRREQEVRVRRQRVRTCLRERHGRGGERREPLLRVGARDRFVPRVGRPVLALRVERRPYEVRRDLESVPDPPDAVDRAVVLDPGRDPAGVPGLVAIEVEGVLPGDLQRHDVRKERREPGAAGPDHGVRLELAGLGRLANHLDPGFLRGRGHRPRRVGSPQDSGVRLPQDEGEVAGLEAREEPAAVLGRQPLDGDLLVAAGLVRSPPPSRPRPGQTRRHRTRGRARFPSRSRARARAPAPATPSVCTRRRRRVRSG